MAEPAKPFACSMPECGMRFTNEDHLHVHTKKHDMVLQLGLEQKNAFVADQTPTPTRFIRNCEEVGLFQDLQNVAANPFDEGFKRAMEAKHGILSLEPNMTTADDVLHTPQMVFPLLDNGEATLYTNNQRNITISRSSSDESGTIKEFETRTISKLTNEVTTISRIVNADDLTIKHTDIQKDIETVSYKNNVIKIASNLIRKEVPILIYTDTATKETANVEMVNKETTTDNDKLDPEKVPMMSQKSIDYVVDSLTCEAGSNAANTATEPNEKIKTETVFPKPQSKQNKMPNIIKKNVRIFQKQPKLMPKKVEDHKVELESNEYEVFIKLPNGKQVRMKPVDDKINAKQILRNSIVRKTSQDTLNMTVKKQTVDNCLDAVPTVVKIPAGTLIPVTLVNQQGTPLTNEDLVKVPMAKINNVEQITKLNNVPLKLPNISINSVPKIVNINVNSTTSKAANVVPVENGIVVSEAQDINKNPGKRKTIEPPTIDLVEESHSSQIQDKIDEINRSDDNGVKDDSPNAFGAKRTRFDLASRSAASRRYRERLKDAMTRQSEENKRLRAANDKLTAEKGLLKLMLMEHLNKCPNNEDLWSRINLLV